MITDIGIMILLSRVTHRIQRDVAALCTKHHITQTQFAVLEVLDAKGPLLVGDIQRLILSTPGNISYVINNLCKKGLTQNSTDPKDRRCTLVSLTDDGRKQIQTLRPLHDAILEKHLSPLSHEEKRTLTRMLLTLYRVHPVEE